MVGFPKSGHKYSLTLSSDIPCSVKAVDPRNKKKKEDEYDGEMGIFYNPSKIMKLVLFIIIIDGTSKEHEQMEQKVLYQSLKGLGRF